MKKKKIAFVSILLAAVVLLPVFLGATVFAETPVHPNNNTTVNQCRFGRRSILFCDDFMGTTFYKDENPWADWYRFHDGTRPASYYDDLSQSLRMRVSGATSGEYSNAEVSLTELYKDNPYLLFGEDTKVDIRMRFSPNMNYEFMNPGTADGTAGFLFWNYYKGTKDPIHGQFDPVRDAFGMTWASETAPGLFIFAAADSDVSMIPLSLMLPGFRMEEFHTYTVERTHTGIKFYIDGVYLYEKAVNGQGQPVIPAEHKFTVDFWADNASYFFNEDGSIRSYFWEVTEDQWLEVDYVKVSEI